MMMTIVVRMKKPGILAKGTLKLQSCLPRTSRQAEVATPGFQLIATCVPLIVKDVITYLSKTLPGLKDRYL